MDRQVLNDLRNFTVRVHATYYDLKAIYKKFISTFLSGFETEMEKFDCKLDGEGGLILFDGSKIKIEFDITRDNEDNMYGKINFLKLGNENDFENILVLYFDSDSIISDDINKTNSISVDNTYLPKYILYKIVQALFNSKCVI